MINLDLVDALWGYDWNAVIEVDTPDNIYKSVPIKGIETRRDKSGLLHIVLCTKKILPHDFNG